MSSNKTLPMERVASVAVAAEPQKAGGGIEFPRHFTREGVSPYDEISGKTRTASITNEKGEVLSSGRSGDSQELVSDGGQYRGVEIFPWADRDSTKGKQRATAGGTRRPDADGMGRSGRLFLLPPMRLRFTTNWRSCF